MLFGSPVERGESSYVASGSGVKSPATGRRGATVVIIRRTMGQVRRRLRVGLSKAE
jgi:hypothetical protein